MFRYFLRIFGVRYMDHDELKILNKLDKRLKHMDAKLDLILALVGKTTDPSDKEIARLTERLRVSSDALNKALSAGE